MPAAGEVVYIEEIPHMVARGNRAAAPTAWTNNTETPVLRVSGVNLIGGHSYMVIVDHLRPNLTVTGLTDRVKYTLRWADTGADATIASTELGRSESANTDDNSVPPIIGWVHPAADVSGASFLLSFGRVSGTATVQPLADTGGINITIIDVNLTVPDTGTDL